jgi:hypothetical protein
MRAAQSRRCGCVPLTRRLGFIPPWIHSPLYSPGTLAPAVMRHCGRFGTGSKTVVPPFGGSSGWNPTPPLKPRSAISCQSCVHGERAARMGKRATGGEPGARLVCPSGSGDRCPLWGLGIRLPHQHRLVKPAAAQIAAELADLREVETKQLLARGRSTQARPRGRR